MDAVLSSRAVNDTTASHRIVGTSKIFGDGILGYYPRDQISDMLLYIRKNDPQAIVRVEPHNPLLTGMALRSTDVEWIVNNEGELGVKVGDQFFFLYKGESLMYGNDMDQYRPVGKREFGESGPKSSYTESPEDYNWLPMDHSHQNNEMAYSE